MDNLINAYFHYVSMPLYWLIGLYRKHQHEDVVIYILWGLFGFPLLVIGGILWWVL